LGEGQVEFEEYKNYVLRRLNEGLEKINILGGEPTLHEDLSKMIEFNKSLGLSTNIYSNGARMENLSCDLNSNDAKIRLSILSYNGLKPITAIKTKLPLTLVLPLSKDNINDIENIMEYCKKLDVKEFVFSTIKKLEKEGDFFEEKEGCLTTDEYIEFLNNFFKKNNYPVKEFHINSRGIFDLGEENTKCNFVNKLPNGCESNCPFDIDIDNIGMDRVSFGCSCKKNKTCLLEKIIVKRK
jgi:MoaA/NifB/PqqE/SkfB family radical SAM enzyme